MIVTGAFLGIWHDIVPEAQAGYLDWHTREHMPERVGIPGFVRGRRGVAIDPELSPRYLTIYEAESAETFRSPQYLERLDHPTPWTQATMPSFRNFVRFANAVALRRGIGDAGYATTARIETEGLTGFDELVPALEDLAELLIALPGVAAVTVARSADEITDYRTQENALRDTVGAEAAVLHHLAVLVVETIDAAAAASVRVEVGALDGRLGDARTAGCATYLVDYRLDHGMI